MKNQNSVRCSIYGFRSSSKPREVSFDTGSDLSMTATTELGPHGISPTAADLLDLAATVYQIERQLTIGRKLTNQPERYELCIRLRNPAAWSERSLVPLTKLLQLLGNASWSIQIDGGLMTPIPDYQKSSNNHKIEQVALFSGGLDSACGAATLRDEREVTCLTSVYTRQKNLQLCLAADLGFSVPVQWRMNWNRNRGRGHSFAYRSFLFLAAAAVVAESWGARKILQFENGILATAIPSSPAWLMTKHAHPTLHQQTADLFSALFEGDWKVENPFLLLTKRGCVEVAEKAFKSKELGKILLQTETCWFLSANRISGGDKTSGIPCGVCIPCIVRGTAMPQEREKYYYDILDNKTANHPQMGAAFRSYYGFLKRIIAANGSLTNFYLNLPVAGRSVINSSPLLSLDNLQKLFQTFADEFMETYIKN